MYIRFTLYHDDTRLPDYSLEYDVKGRVGDRCGSQYLEDGCQGDDVKAHRQDDEEADGDAQVVVDAVGKVFGVHA